MKKTSFVLAMLIIGLASYSLKAQTGWILQTNPLGSDTLLGKIQFVSSTEGWISASHGRLLHTINAGTTWNIVIPFPDDTLSSFADPAVSMWWVNQTHGWKINWFGTGFSDAHGAVIHKTTDGGVTWEKKVLSTGTGDLGVQIQFVDENNGWATIGNASTGMGGSMRSTDGGNTWNQITTFPAGIFYFIDSNNGWAISFTGESSSPPYTIQHTTNGGVNWTTQFTDNTQGAFLAIQFIDLNNGWVVGENGKIFKTSNGGNNWSAITNSGLTFNHYSKCLFFLDQNNGWIGSHENGSNPIIIHTIDGGASWTTQNIPASYALYSIFFWDVNNGWFTADHQIGYYSGTTGIEEQLLNDQININPNPSNGAFYINFKNAATKYEVEIYNVYGEKVYETSNLNHQTSNKINLSNSPGGIYLIKIRAGEKIYTKKFVIQ